MSATAQATSETPVRMPKAKNLAATVPRLSESIAENGTRPTASGTMIGSAHKLYQAILSVRDDVGACSAAGLRLGICSPSDTGVSTTT